MFQYLSANIFVILVVSNICAKRRGDIFPMELKYTIPQAARALALKEPTFRKYYMLIEKKGYLFSRTQQGHVMFTEDNLRMIKNILDEKNKPRVTLEGAIQKIIVNTEGYEEPEVDDNEENQTLHAKIDRLTAMVEQQQETIQRLESKLDHGEYKQLENSEKVKQLEEGKSKEEEKEIVETAEEVKQEEKKEEKKSIWQKLFG